MVVVLSTGSLIYLPITIFAGYQEFPHWMELAINSSCR